MQPENEMQQPPSTDWAAVLIAFMAGVIAAAHFGKTPGALPEIRAQIPISLIVGGWVMSVFSLVGTLFGTLAGTLTDRLGARILATVGLITLGIGSLTGASAASGQLLLISRVIEGLGFIAVAISAPVLITRGASARQTQLCLGIWSTYMPLGMALVMLVIPIMVTTLEWRLVWSGFSLLTLFCAGLLWFTSHPAKRPSYHQPPQTGVMENLRLTLTTPGPWLLTLCFGGYTLQWISLMAWLPSLMIEQHGLTNETTGLLTALVVAVNIPGNLSVGRLLRLGVKRWAVLFVSGLGMAVTAYGIFHEDLGDLTRLALCFAFSYFGGMTPGAILSGAPAVSPTPGQIGTVNGMMVQGSHMGQLLGPPALAALATYAGGWQDTRWLMLFGAGLIMLLSLLFRRLKLGE